MPAPPCPPGCRCGKHQRTPEHNAKISAAMKAGGHRPPGTPPSTRRCTECGGKHHGQGLCRNCWHQRYYQETKGSMYERL